MNVLRYLLIPSAAMALGACGVTKPPQTIDIRRELVSRRSERGELSVLFIGNSYSFGVPKAFGKLAGSHGKRLHVDQVTHSGWTLARHVADRGTLQKIQERHWDVVVLQEQSRLPSLPVRRAWMMVPAVMKLAEKVRAQGGIPVLYQTWGRRDGDSNRPHDDFHAMNVRLREGCRAAAEKAGGLPVVPAGDAWQREVLAGRGDRLFQPDGSHPTPQGDVLTAEVFYRTFFGGGPSLQ